MSSTLKNISLYIPHIFANFDENYVKNAFESKIGKVSRLDLVAKMGQNGTTYNAAYIHFEYWYNSVQSSDFQERLLDPNDKTCFVYDAPWYWIVLENKSQKFTPGDRKIRIDLKDLFKPCESKEIVVDEIQIPELTDEEVAWIEDSLEADEDEVDEFRMEEIDQAIDEEEKNYVGSLLEEINVLNDKVKHLEYQLFHYITAN